MLRKRTTGHLATLSTEETTTKNSRSLRARNRLTEPLTNKDSVTVSIGTLVGQQGGIHKVNDILAGRQGQHRNIMSADFDAHSLAAARRAARKDAPRFLHDGTQAISMGHNTVRPHRALSLAQSVSDYATCKSRR
jgi:hypothetical protein